MADSNKTEKATPQRRKKAREQGQVARSRELGGVLGLLGAIITLSVLGNGIVKHWVGFYTGLLNSACDEDISASGPVLFWTSVEVFRWIVPVLLVLVLLSVSATLAQGGFNFAPSALAFKFDRIHPGKRVGQIFSLSTVGALGKSLLPFVAIALFAVSAIREHWSELARASGEDLRSLLPVLGDLIRTVGWKAAVVLLAWSAVDLLLTWRQSESSLRMSKEELKQEFKESDGNPFTKGQVRRRQRALRNRKPLDAAATATMVVTNPTHFAVALKYDHQMAAPEVVAKGRDLLAQRIKSIAQENNVPIMENKQLARALYRGVEVGAAIPAELYQAVAEILVAVFRAQAELQEQEALRRRRNASGEVISGR